jgi:hypothetical protein
MERVMEIVNLGEVRKAKAKPALLELQDELNALFADDRFIDLTVAECLGLLEIFKWEWVQTLKQRDDY